MKDAPQIIRLEVSSQDVIRALEAEVERLRVQNAERGCDRTIEEHKAAFKVLVERPDGRIIRDETGVLYYVSAAQRDNLIYCLESGASQINALTNRAETAEAERDRYREELLRIANDCTHTLPVRCLAREALEVKP